MKRILTFDRFLNEDIVVVKTTPDIEKFSENRFKGANDIATKAEAKGGDALLTYHHFIVKLPYYDSAKQGSFESESAFSEYQALLNQLVSSSQGSVNLGQIEFQELVGKIEVLGELLIKEKE